MDYDSTDMAKVYDRARAMGAGDLHRWLDRVEAHAPGGSIRAILDIGCGTGRFTGALVRRLGGNVVGIDPSDSMIAQARAKNQPAAVFAKGDAADLPVKSGACDLAFLSMVYHHIPDAVAAAREWRRVLRPGGRVLIRNSVRDIGFPYDRFVPTFRAIMEAHMPSRAEIRRDVEAGGLTFVAHEVFAHAMAENWAELAQKAALRADSNLVRLAPADFDAGMAALRAQAATPEGKTPVMIDIDFFVFEKAP